MSKIKNIYLNVEKLWNHPTLTPELEMLVDIKKHQKVFLEYPTQAFFFKRFPNFGFQVRKD